MRLYAVTMTDPSEPWGVAVVERKLYRTPTELIDAFNAAFDSFLAADDTSFGHHGDFARRQVTELPRNYEGMTELEAMEEEFSRFYSVGAYELVEASP